jgi:formylmethanofuran dehydrogenase subunit C
MSGFATMTLRAPLDGPVDLDALTSQPLASLSEARLAGTQVLNGRYRVALGELFLVRGGDTARLCLEGDLTYAHGIGAGMAGGEIIINGSVGNRLGTRMTGGSIEVHGPAGHDAGASMAGGTLRVHGDAGDRTGGAAAGAAKGMTGGEIVVDGSAGMETAVRTRRGLIIIGGDTGAMGARSMIAGTLVVFGRTGDNPGVANKRGSIVAIGDIDIPVTYRYACHTEFSFVRLLMTYLRRRYSLPISDAIAFGRYRRYSGDAGVPGKGEILQWTAE